MTRCIYILVTITTLLLGSCFSSDKKVIREGFSKLTIVVDDSSTFYLDRILIRNSNEEFRLRQDYDTIRKKLVYVYDSLKNNDYDIILSSLLNKTLKMPITLTADTTLFISKGQLPNFDKITNISNFLSSLQTQDTVCIAYSSIGCFHNYSTRTLIYKDGDNYTAEFTTDTSQDYNRQQIISIKKQLVKSFGDTLKKLESGCIDGFARQLEIKRYCDKELSKAKNSMDSIRATMWLYTSTTSSAIYINKGNKVFELTNNGINEIPYFNSFMSALKLE